jgi:hypothetical protein
LSLNSISCFASHVTGVHLTILSSISVSISFNCMISPKVKFCL